MLLAVYVLFLIMVPAYFAHAITVSARHADEHGGVSEPVDDDGENNPFLDEEEPDDTALPERSLSI